VAYSLNDYYRPLRLTLRINGLILGLGLGLLFIVYPRALFLQWGLIPTGPAWPVRCAGATLIALGCLSLLAANERIIPAVVLITMTVGNGLLALVLFVSYLQGEFAALPALGLIGLILIFLLCLISAVVPLRYIRTEYRMG